MSHLASSSVTTETYHSKANDNPSIEYSNQDYFLAGIHPERVRDLDSYLWTPGLCITETLWVMDERWQTEFLVSSQLFFFLSGFPVFK